MAFDRLHLPPQNGNIVSMSRLAARPPLAGNSPTQKMPQAFFARDRQQATGNRQQATGNYTHFQKIVSSIQ
jgi:hypothetical protein